jgi:predicted RNA binding protein YcfA (HicA-like mRNA interferase family)
MSKKEKRLQRILQNPKDVRFSELDVVLTEYGYERRQSGKGSNHYVYSHPEVNMLVTLVSHGQDDILPEYQVKKAIKSLKFLLEDV